MKPQKLPKAFTNPRPVEEITKLYNQKCWEAGNVQYRLYVGAKEQKNLEDQLEFYNQEMMDLNQEAHASRKAAEAALPAQDAVESPVEAEVPSEVAPVVA